MDPAQEKMVLVVLALAVSLPMVLLSVPLVRGKVARNKLYGFRTSSTLSDDRIWYPANKAGGQALMWGGLSQMAVSAMAFLGAFRLGVLGMLVLVTVTLAFVLAYSVFRLRRIEAQVKRHER